MRLAMLLMFTFVVAGFTGCGNGKPTLDPKAERPTPDGEQGQPRPRVVAVVPKNTADPNKEVPKSPMEDGKTLIEVQTVVYSPTDGYKVLPNVNIHIERGPAKLREEGKLYNPWQTDKAGEANILVANGEPITLIIEMVKEDYVPQIQKLATAGSPHKLSVALIKLGDLLEFEQQFPDAQKCFRDLVLVRERFMDGPIRDALDRMIDKARPLSSDHPRFKKPGAKRDLSPEEEKAAGACLKWIRDCQITEGEDKGALNMSSSGAAARIHPYFANKAALALLAVDVNENDRAVVHDWLLWYATRLLDPALEHHKVGAVSIYQDKGGKALEPVSETMGGMDAVDSWAAAYLLVVARYQRIPGNAPPDDKIIAAAVRSFKAIQEMSKEGDGLTLVKPTYRLKFLKNNIEVYSALVETGYLFERYGWVGEADRAFFLADRIGAALAVFPQPGYFPVSEAEAKRGQQIQADTDLCGLALLAGEIKPEDQKAIWLAAVKGTKPDVGPVAVAPVERWLTTAQHLQDRGVVTAQEVTAWRQRVVKEAESFDQNMYILRPAETVLALVDGPGRLFEVLPPRRP